MSQYSSGASYAGRRASAGPGRASTERGFGATALASSGGPPRVDLCAEAAASAASAFLARCDVLPWLSPALGSASPAPRVALDPPGARSRSDGARVIEKHAGSEDELGLGDGSV